MTFTRRARAVLLALVGSITLLGVAGCAEQTVTVPTQPTESMVDNTVDPMSLDRVLDGVVAQNLSVTARRDVTGDVCPTAGCTTAEAADELTVLHFPTTGRAEIYRGSHPESFQVLDVVVTFPDTSSAGQRKQYSEAVQVALR